MLLYYKCEWVFSYVFFVVLVVLGVLMDQYFLNWLMSFYYGIGVQIFKDYVYFNFLLIRLGYVFVVVVLFMWFVQAWCNIFLFLLKIGSEILVIYEVYYVFLYSIWFGIGFLVLWVYFFMFVQMFIGVLIFLVFFVVFIVYIDCIWAIWCFKFCWAF